MTELLLAGTIFLGLAGAAALVSLVDWYTLFGAGAVLTVLGLFVGVLAGLYYHLLLYRALAPRGQLERGWWIHPMRAHPALEPNERGPVLRYFYVGAVGFVLTIVGCALVAVASLRS